MAISTPIESSAAPGAAAPRDHFVQFYERDSVLVEEVARYLRNGVEAGIGAVMIGAADHRAQVLEAWRLQGFDHAAAVERRQLILLDARETLDRFMVGGWPDKKRFVDSVGALVGESIERFGDLVAFGEMVALLWADGLHEAAVQLERLWNELAGRHRFALYCAYPLRDCARADLSGAFHDVCRAHSHVIPAESLAGARTEPEQVRIIAELQQKAASLEHELRARREAEAKLASRDRELSDFLENSVVALHRVGQDGTILWANRAEMEMLGYKDSEYIGHNITEFHVDKGLIAQILAGLASGQILRDQPARLRCKDGSIRHVLITSNAQMEDGKFVSTRCFTRDVSDRWLAQEALRERGAVLHLAMQGARMGYWVADLESNTLRGSHELATLFGLSGAIDWSIESFVALMHPEDRAPFQDALRAAIEARGMLMCQFRIRRETSEWRWFEGRGEAIYDDSGRATRFYGVCMDVTARKRDEQLLMHLAAVVDSAEDAIISKTLDGVVTSWNAGARRIFGYEAAEMIGRPITVLIPPELFSEEAEILAKLRAGGRIEHYQTTRVAKDGTRRQVSLAISPMRDASGRIVGASKIAREVKPKKATA